MKNIDECKIITVCSFKGGTGKTAISLNLAKVAGHYGIKTLLWEFDKNPGSLSSILDLDPNINVISAIMNPEGLPFYTNKIKRENFDVLLGPSDSFIGEEIDGIEKIEEVMNLAKGNYQLIIMDLGPYLDKVSIQVMNESNLILLIVEPEVSSISKAVANIDLIRDKTDYDLSKKIWVVLNKITKRDNITISQISNALGMPICVKIAYDKKYRETINKVESTITKTKITKGCKKILKRIYPDIEKPKKQRSFLFFKGNRRK